MTAVSSQLADAQRDLYSADGGPAAVTRIVGVLLSAQPGAPVQIRRALTDLIGAFQQAQQALEHPTKRSQQQLSEAAKVLAEQGDRVTAYATSKCE